MKRNRDYGVELYRVLMMFGICMIHAVSLGGGRGSAWVSSALLSCVCGFVFISGYYGVRFKWMKLVTLYGLAFFAAAITTVLYRWYDPVECGNVWVQFAFVFRDYWFLNAYAVLMLMAPILNVAIEHLDRPDVRVALVLAVVCTIGWSFLAQLPYLRTYLPKSPGLHDYSGFMFMGIYIIAALWRKYVEPRKVLIFAGGGGGIIAAYNDYRYSPALPRRVFLSFQHRSRGDSLLDLSAHDLPRMAGQALCLSRAESLLDILAPHACIRLWSDQEWQGVVDCARCPLSCGLFEHWHRRFRVVSCRGLVQKGFGVCV